MAGLAAAWRLTRPSGPGADVTVYQCGGRLGGKGASSRGPHGRIEEHGLHVWPGYYDNAFALMTACYEELSRPASSPITTVRDAFFPAGTIGLFEPGRREPWVATFPHNTRLPGEGDGASVDPLELVERASSLLGAFGESVGSPAVSARAVLSTSARPPATETVRTDGLLRRVPAVLRDPRARMFGELIAAMARGSVTDGLGVRGYRSLDGTDFSAWLRRHGASPAVAHGPVVRGLYDFVFGYEGGDRARPAFAAGTGLHLAARLFLSYRGSLFWKVRAGMGDVVFAPLYQVLARRGVRFEFFHRVDALHLSADSSRVGAISLGRQVELRPGVAAYDPLVEVRGVPVFRHRPDLHQVRADGSLHRHDLEAAPCAWPDAGRLRLEAGRDFDRVILAIPIGVAPSVAAELIRADERWRDMAERLATVATQSVQVWLAPDERALGWRHAAATVTGLGAPFDTFASMSHTLEFESWAAGGAPLTTASLCGVLGNGERPARKGAVDAALARVWPAYDPTTVVAQYRRVNTDPSARYVQSLPGTGRYRMAADGSGFANLVLAGDWIDSGLNAGCIEAATLAGLQAANAVMGANLTDGTVGFRPASREPAGARR
jgi:uncharacterized protein with NAD-binding domain and iron-sulfur cluster